MINKHLPGVHNQKTHGSQGPTHAPVPIVGVLSGLKEKYHLGKSGSISRPIYVALGFESAFTESAEDIDGQRQYILNTAIDYVTDPNEAAEFVDDVVRLAKDHGYSQVSLRGVPIDTAIKHDAIYKLTDAHIVSLTVDAFKLLHNKYDLTVPKELEDSVTSWFKKAISKYTPSKFLPVDARGAYLVKVKDLVSITHPLYPDVPLYIESLETAPISRAAIVSLK